MVFNIKDRMLAGTDVGTDVIDMTQSHIHNRLDRVFTRTFMWMGIILLCAFGAGYYAHITGFQASRLVYFGAMLGGLGIVIAVSFLRQRMSYGVIAALLIVFGLLEGVGISVALSAYANVPSIFLVTAIMFGVLAVIGNATQIDITKRRPILFGGLIALIVAQLVGMGLAMFTSIDTSTFVTIYSIGGVILFSAFVIFDMNLLKQMALMDDDRVELIMGLSIFLTFINLFNMLLNLLGRE